MEALRPFATSRRRQAFAALVVGVALGLTGVVADVGVAGAVPDAEAVRKARDAFDEGSRAYRAGRYELAASQFEAADAAVPSAQALRMAIRSRAKAEQRARAATLSALALRRYDDDAKTKELAQATIAASERELHRLEIACASPCVLAVGTRAVHGKASKAWAIYLDEGKATVSASFDEGGDDQLDVQAVGGGSHEVQLEPQSDDPEVTPSPAPGEADPAPAPLPEPSSAASGGEPDLVAVEGPSWIESPWVFGFWALATAGVGGVTIWSGIDTLNNPGTEVVEEACVGEGTDCPEYQQGLNSQLRTNILIGATAGTAALATIFAIFVTDWDGEPDAETALRIRPSLGPSDAGLGLGGRF